jgi:hypothetical protein
MAPAINSSDFPSHDSAFTRPAAALTFLRNFVSTPANKNCFTSGRDNQTLSRKRRNEFLTLRRMHMDTLALTNRFRIPAASPAQ